MYNGLTRMRIFFFFPELRRSTNLPLLGELSYVAIWDQDNLVGAKYFQFLGYLDLWEMHLVHKSELYDA